jgi:triacylglycerol lipase
VFVVFRGTADLRNWITDLDCELVNERISESVSGAKIHAGFQQALKSVIPELRETLTRLALERRDVYFTGHSLGGALAMLAAARMQNEEWRMQNENSSRPIPNSPGIWLYTFGQPRVGNGAWARWYDGRLKERSWRIVHAEDIVPRVPWLLRMFRHAGHEVFYPGLTDRTDRTDRTNRWRMDVPWWRKAPGDVFGTWAEWRRKGRIALLADHRVETYVKLLNP